MKGGSMVYTIALLFVGCLVMVGQCRPEPDSTYEDGHRNVATVLSSLDDNKLTLQWCVARDCVTKGEPHANHCFCCLNAPGAPCFNSRLDCQSQCPTMPPGK
ncbi:hypothetical protein CFC21_091114 [Triticum aestivum]|uniref:Embryo surrounding factor 1 brassicaceae domain-containing protein n=2 Tax=Triticum aestivum TaxID=4565 RepID=A0A9R1MSR5_WHEAT|nr:hypothetical protein CFC21_091114 [Triticum aestivum]